MTAILSVDPGLTGALAVRAVGTAILVELVDMPTYVRELSTGKGRNTLNEQQLFTSMRNARHIEGASLLVIEKVGGMPGQSGPAAFNFGYGVGLILGFGRALGYRIERVEPATWKRALRCPADKQAARARASELMPESAHLWPNKGHHGRAEAAMLGLYAERNLL